MGFGSPPFRAKLRGMSADEQPRGDLMTRHRLAEVLDDIDRQAPDELEALLRALITAAWPTPSARDQ